MCFRICERCTATGPLRPQASLIAVRSAWLCGVALRFLARFLVPGRLPRIILGMGFLASPQTPTRPHRRRRPTRRHPAVHICEMCAGSMCGRALAASAVPLALRLEIQLHHKATFVMPLTSYGTRLQQLHAWLRYSPSDSLRYCPSDVIARPFKLHHPL